MEEPFIPVHTRRNRSSRKNKRDKITEINNKKKIEDPPLSYNALHFAKEEMKDKIKEISNKKHVEDPPIPYNTLQLLAKEERQNKKINNINKRKRGRPSLSLQGTNSSSRSKIRQTK